MHSFVHVERRGQLLGKLGGAERLPLEGHQKLRGAHDASDRMD